MSSQVDQPVIAAQTLAQNEAVENVLSRFRNKELFIPQYQRDADQWDDIKKSLLIESVLNRLTIPAFYLAASEDNPEISEVVDGQQRLTTLLSFYTDRFALSSPDECPYYGTSAHYAGKRYHQLADVWQRAFRRYNLTLVSLPTNMELSLRLEIFKRINEGGTPLSSQDIRIGYYSESQAVRYIQAVGIFDDSREGSRRIIGEVGSWPWSAHTEAARLWKEWWSGSKISLGQTASEMFLWYIISSYRTKVDAILSDHSRLAANLKLTFRGNTDEVLDIACAQLRHEEQHPNEPPLLPNRMVILEEEFPRFARWWYQIRVNCGSDAGVSKYRALALLIPALDGVFSSRRPSFDQWTLIGKFLRSTRDTARTILKVDFPESKGRWKAQREQLDGFDRVVEEISNR